VPQRIEAMAATPPVPFLFSDQALARRLERAEGHTGARFVEARAKLFPGSGAQWIEVGGAYVMFDGVSSPLTQTFGLGLLQEASPSDLSLIEEFYHQRGAPVFHEVSPLAGVGLAALLNERGYQPVEFASVMFRSIGHEIKLALSRTKGIQVGLAGSNELELWAQTAAKGWSEAGDFSQLMSGMAHSAARAGARLFLAKLDGQPIAAGALGISAGVALLAGASTIPDKRRLGAQLALLDSRLRYAAEQGCDIAMMGAEPGSASQRNAERHGFRIAYTRTKWRLGQPPA